MQNSSLVRGFVVGFLVIALAGASLSANRVGRGLRDAEGDCRRNTQYQAGGTVGCSETSCGMLGWCSAREATGSEGIIRFCSCATSITLVHGFPPNETCHTFSHFDDFLGWHQDCTTGTNDCNENQRCAKSGAVCKCTP